MYAFKFFQVISKVISNIISVSSKMCYVDLTVINNGWGSYLDKPEIQWEFLMHKYMSNSQDRGGDRYRERRYDERPRHRVSRII